MSKASWIITVVLAAAVALGAGYFLRGVLSSPGAGSEMSAAAVMGGGGAPPVVHVITVKKEQASPVRDYIARVEPVQQVSIMAQVAGTIEEVCFREGSRVAAGDLLFRIDSASYEAELAQRKAELAQAEATLEHAEKYLAMLKSVDDRSVSKSDLDAAVANESEGRALVQKAKAAVRRAEIDLEYTEIKSPIDGRVGRALITKGNLVSPSSGALATVVQLDPIRVVFAMPDSEYLTEFERYSNEEGYAPIVRVRLSNGVVLPAAGEIDFDDNQMNAATGTIDIRMRFPNADRMLVPNNFVNVLVQDGNEPERIVVPAEAVMHNADGAFVWTVTADNTVVAKPVSAGVHVGARRIIESGLDEGDRVVVAGVQKVQPGAMVQPQAVDAE
ncbi:MAG: efflux RND transporter periplasmic adaptor subunit [Pontiellaceae bacterium]|nr:efflux RND transporter periplasmic adaptor subunit [Pontiellaceae bacterium]